MEEIEHLGQILNVEDILKRFTSPSFLPKNEIQYFEPVQKQQIATPTNAEQIEQTPEKTVELQIFAIDFTLRDDEGTKLNNIQKAAINKIIVKHMDVFDESGPATEQAEHCIETLNDLPIASAPYRLPTLKREALKKEI